MVRLYFLIAVILLSLVPVAGSTTFKLERLLPDHDTDLSQLRLADYIRSRQIGNLYLDVPLIQSKNLTNLGFYVAKVKIGSPPKEFNLIVDTSAYLPWVSCFHCVGCPVSNEFGLQHSFYDPHSSTTSSMLSCSSEVCRTSFKPSNCSSHREQCPYFLSNQSPSAIGGYVVSDMFHTSAITFDSQDKNVSAPINFGCTNYRSKGLSGAMKVFDGVLALGGNNLSVISQLSSHGLIPKIFSHCFGGWSYGGGTLTLGATLEADYVYTPLVTSRGLYELNMQNIFVGGKIVPIDQTVFASENGGTVVDTGTSLAVLAEKAYDQVILSINSFVSQHARPVIINGGQCYRVSNSISGVFPLVNFKFEGGAYLAVQPEEYLLWHNSDEGLDTWCVGFHKIEGHSVTILGGLALKDKIVVYDLANHRMGWKNYKCAVTAEVPTTDQSASSNLSMDSLVILIVTITVASLMYLSMFE